MILFFGTRPGKANTKVLPSVACPYCGQVGTLAAVSQPNYFHLFWIPLFTISTSKYVECSHCKRVFYQEEFSMEMNRAFKNI
ncbi:zinc-ribbon domain-containing protein [Flagellimonas sp.]|uniref:zinc-ribbon domain-containing protein n=1 Tax=Flagellimonas sp. TaxID=2058762 RepID=UPI003F4A6BBC